MTDNNKKTKLLAPAGSYDALCAAIAAGADEVYFGASEFNARIGAKNFSDDELERAIKLCRVCGVSSNITVNTVHFDRELNDVVELIYNAAVLGADAFIIQDPAVALLVKKQIPSAVIHASTQCACHNRDGAQRLYDAGFSRVVLARELSYEDIMKITADAPYETEIFAHGALCVSHSGQCLFSSVVGGRSGNRGMCAQPCRMEYSLDTCAGCRKGYLLSLKDLTLAQHIKQLCFSGVAALKLEGRMKSPEYVYGVTRIFRTLLTEERNATADEMRELESIFSRSGFTDGYYTKKYLTSNSDMYGVRSEKQKAATRIIEKQTVIEKPRRPISAVCGFEAGKIPALSFLCGEHTVTVRGENALESAKDGGSGATFESISKNLTKLGNTDFSLSLDDISMVVGDGTFVPASLVNDLRRRAADALYAVMTEPKNTMRTRMGFIPPRNEPSHKEVAVRLYFTDSSQIEKKIVGYKNIESLVFPLSVFDNDGERKRIKELTDEYRVGILFPRVMLESEKGGVCAALCRAKEAGAKFCEVSNIGHIDVAQKNGFEVYGGVGLNIANSLSAEYYTEILGLRSIVLSPELKFGALRDIAKKDGVRYCFYAKGRLPLMVLESCIVRSCGLCRKKRGEKTECGILNDRIGARFPVVAQKRYDTEFPCRNIIYNSVMTDHRMKKELYCSGLDVICISAEDDGMPM